MSVLNPRLLLGALTVALAASAAPSVGRGDTPPQGPVETASAPQQPSAVATQYRRPHRRLVIRSRFVPWARPSPAQVRRIVALEAPRWGASAGGLEHRIGCESGFRWYAQNGQYVGLGQFAPSTFERGLRTIRTRRVALVSRRWRWKRIRRVEMMSDGSRRWSWAGRVHQRVVHRRVGVIPRRPPVTHGWAQIRVMAQAIAGRSAVSNGEWSCST